MLRRLNLPEWVLPEYPGMRYVMGGTRRRTSRQRWILQIVLGIILFAVYITVTLLITPSQMLSVSEQVLSALHLPAILGQTVLGAGVMVAMIGTINSEKRRQSWDDLRATTGGVRLALRAQWSAAIFYRTGGLLLLLYIVRLVMIALILYDLTGFTGDYLDFLSGGIVPALPPAAAIVLLALTMTAAFILPLSALGLDAAIGLFVATFVRHAVWVAVAQVLAALLRVMLPLGLFALWYSLYGSGTGEPWQLWFTSLGFGGFADWGMRTLHLGSTGDLWGKIDYGIYLGAGLLALAFAQAALTEGLLQLAVRRAERYE